MKTEEVNYLVQDKQFKAFVAYPEQQNSPLVLIVHTWAGRDEFVQNKAIELAQEGFVAMAVDMYGDAKVGASTEENQSMMAPLIEDREKLKSVITAAVETGKQLEGVDTSKIAAIGYCFGGLVVLDLARSGIDINGVVSFHGLLMGSDISDKGIQAKVLVLHGERDPMVPLSMIDEFQQEMTEAQADWQLHSYGNAYHAFTNPDANDPDFGTQYNQNADKRSWQSMMNFFSEIF
ncbi:MAG: dienelactone hydrolase family protein [Gammaproteobacteria bacterium]